MNHIKKSHFILCIQIFLINETFGSILNVEMLKSKNKTGLLSHTWPKMKNFDIWDTSNRIDKNHMKDKNHKIIHGSDSLTTLSNNVKNPINYIRNGKGSYSVL